MTGKAKAGPALMTPDTRKAACACGRLIIEVKGDPYLVAACSCTQCQRRTGNVFGVSAYFRGPQLVSVEGAPRSFVRGSDSGRQGEFHFCGQCGSTVFYTRPGKAPSEGFGVAAGCFADPHFARPMLATWCATKHDWVEFPPDIPMRETQPDWPGASR
jgi:hypothetical protein